MGHNGTIPRRDSSPVHLWMRLQGHCSNYLRCDHLWTLLVGCIAPVLSNLQNGRNDEELSGFRACLINVSPFSILMCMVAFKTYHALKMDYRSDIDKAIEIDDFNGVWNRAIELILHSKCEFVQKFI